MLLFGIKGLLRQVADLQRWGGGRSCSSPSWVVRRAGAAAHSRTRRVTEFTTLAKARVMIRTLGYCQP